MSINLETCFDCDAVFSESMAPECPVCKLREEFEETIKKLEAQVEKLLIGEERRRRARPIG